MPDVSTKTLVELRQAGWRYVKFDADLNLLASKDSKTWEPAEWESAPDFRISAHNVIDLHSF
jgi:hypothetical protein